MLFLSKRSVPFKMNREQHHLSYNDQTPIRSLGKQDDYVRVAPLRTDPVLRIYTPSKKKTKSQ